MKMVTHLFTDAGRTWRQAAKVNSQGRMIYEALQKELQDTPTGRAMAKQIEANAQYITSVPRDISQAMTKHIASRALAGMRPEAVAAELQKMYPHLSDVKANLIARTEAAKTATALTQARCEEMGVKWYVWRTSEDSRVRESHRYMDRVLVSWDDPPSPEQLAGESHIYGHYHAGCIFNCRCYAAPL
ncbi:phage head morphogenesis protein, partial [Alicyclobacillus hesperidum]|uniref:phage head morphogenesis protein n=1 Tax=Alicyclobacillus hesperidum TaxID=89784 RepID=UPI00249118F7